MKNKKYPDVSMRNVKNPSQINESDLSTQCSSISYIADKARLMPSFSSIISVLLSTPCGEE